MPNGLVSLLNGSASEMLCLLNPLDLASLVFGWL